MEEIKLGALIDKIYRKLKDRGLYLLLYAAAFIPCAFIALNSAFPAFDDLAASEGTLFASVLAGHEWQGEIFVADTRGGYLWSALYTPAMFLFDTATLRFRAMFLFNAAVLSFAPVLAYRLTFRLNVTLAWQRFLLAGASISP
ncbi:MAG: hypothetical protein LBN40_01690, partial [Oscillospiraceae bacterium]|nr:hypothetical protein [Oscillospiraceae bacterium]